MSAIRRGVWSLALALALLWAFSLGALPTALGQAPLTVAISDIKSADFPTVRAVVTVVDNLGRPVLGLGPESWELVEDDRPVGQVQVGTAVDLQEPLIISLVIDVSGSMAGRPMDDAKAAAIAFVQTLGEKDRGALFTFADRPALVQNFTENKQELIGAVAGLRPAGNTALYDAAIMAARATTRQTDGRRIVVVMTDGDDTSSESTLDETREALGLARVPVFIVGLGHAINKDILNQLAAESGGTTVYAASSSDLQAAFRTLADQLRQQYLLSFRSGLSADNRQHTLLVRARVGGARAEAKGMFVATSIPPRINVVSPTEGQEVEGVVKVQVEAEAAGQVTRVSAVAAGRVIATLESPPYEFDWDTSRLAIGNHALDVSVHDNLGNRATQKVTVRVTSLLPPTATAVPAVAPEPAPRQTRSPLQTYAMMGGAGVAALALLGLVLRLGRRGSSKKVNSFPLPAKEVWTGRCHTCGEPLRRGQDCAKCAVEAEEIIQRRLRELAGARGDGDGDAGLNREGQR